MGLGKVWNEGQEGALHVSVPESAHSNTLVPSGATRASSAAWMLSHCKSSYSTASVEPS